MTPCILVDMTRCEMMVDMAGSYEMSVHIHTTLNVIKVYKIITPGHRNF